MSKRACPANTKRHARRLTPCSARSSPNAGFCHILTVQSALPEHSSLPSPSECAKDHTGPCETTTWPAHVTGFAEWTRHSRRTANTVRNVGSNRIHGSLRAAQGGRGHRHGGQMQDYSRQVAPLLTWCPTKHAICCALPMSHTRTDPSSLPAAIVAPSGLTASDVAASRIPADKVRGQPCGTDAGTRKATLNRPIHHPSACSTNARPAWAADEAPSSAGVQLGHLTRRARKGRC